MHLSIRPCVAATLVLAGFAQSRPLQPSAACTVSWSQDQLIRSSDGRPMLIDVRSVARWRNQLAIAGDPSFRWASSSAAGFRPGEQSSNQLIGGALVDIEAVSDSDLRAVVLPTPPGGTNAMQPRVGASPDGRLHLVYGVIADVAHRAWDTPPDSVLHTRWDGARWERPTTVRGFRRPIWDPVSPTPIISIPSGIAIAVPIDSPDSTTAVVARLDTRGHWQATTLATGGASAAYMRLATVGSSLLMAWIGAEPISGTVDRNAVFVSRSSDWGKTWEPRHRVVPPGGGRAYDPAFAIDAHSTAYLIWAKRSRVGALPDSIASAMSVDSGRTWRVLPGSFVAHGFSTLSVASSGGPIVAAFRDSAEGRIHIRLLSDDAWSMPEHDAGPVSVGTPIVTPVSGDASRQPPDRATRAPSG